MSRFGNHAAGPRNQLPLPAIAFPFSGIAFRFHAKVGGFFQLDCYPTTHGHLLEGTGFDALTPINNIVTFATSGGGTANATVVQAGGTQLHVRIPETATQGNVTVTVGLATSNALVYIP